MTGAALAAREVSKRFGRAAALRDLDLEAPAGRWLAVLGPNGAGKSTLLRLFAGLARPSAGTVTVDGHAATDRRSRAATGYLGHQTLLSPQLTVRENLHYAARLYGLADARERVDALVESEGLGVLAERPAAALSRGQAQRAAIARALVHRPRLLLLDEPFTGLDRGAANRLSERLAGLRAEGCSALLVTHELAPVTALADEALVLAGGATLWHGEISPDPSALEQAFDQALATGDAA